MIPFLKGYLGTLSAVQSKQVFRILSQMQEKGEIRDHRDFQKKLADLVQLVRDDRLEQRTPELEFLEGDMLESDAIRTFIDQARLDFEAILGETERMGNTMRAHNKILSNNYFDALEASVTELESEVRAYEVLEHRKFSGFSTVVKSLNFSGSISSPSADLDDDFASTLFIDSHGDQELFVSGPGVGEGGLHLASSRTKPEFVTYFDGISLVNDETTPQTVLNVSPDDNVPIKAIDGSDDSAWRHSILLSEHPDLCRLKLNLSFVGAQRVNTLIINPLADIPMEVVGVSYTDSGGAENIIDVGSSQIDSSTLSSNSGLLGSSDESRAKWILSNTKIVIPIGDVVANKITVTFQQSTAGEAKFYYFDEDAGSWKYNPELEDLLRSVMTVTTGSSSYDVPVQLGFLPPDDEGLRLGNFVEYVFGLKEVSVSTREFENNGLFVPEPFSLSYAPSTLALYTDIDFPVGDSTSVEFTVRKENYNSDGALIDVETFPFLPYGSSSVDEKLFLLQRYTSSINDTAVLRFYPDFSESFTVYRDGEEISLGTDYQISVNGGTGFESVIPPGSTAIEPNECLIKILSPSTSAIFRIEYSPKVSGSTAGSEVWVNSTRTVRLGRYQTYVFNNERPSETVSSCKIGLQIITRSNTLNTRVSPYLREIVLLGS